MHTLPLRDRQPDAEPPARPSPLLEYEPALDGVRGACLLAVLLFHSGFAWASGGFLGVSTFFTLSGFLITTLLLGEHGTRGEVSVRRFWERRLRRLVPAALVTVAAVVFTAPLWLSPAQRLRLELDAVATLFYLVNWRFVGAEYAYELIFIDPSPLQHFWSLAIEGQFYLLFPLGLALLLRLPGGRRALGLVLLVLVAGSVAVGFTASSAEEAQHRLYYGTDARAAELLVGALLALVPRGARADRRRERVLGALGIVAGVLVVAAWSRAEVGDAWLYHGGFAAYAGLSALVVAAALEPASLVRRALSPRWLRWIGKVSYGGYLFHWPLFMVLTPGTTGLSSAPLLALRLTATLALAALSYRVLELPVRRSVALRGPRFTRVTAAALAVVLAGAVLISPVPPSLQMLIVANAARSALGMATEPADDPRPRIAMFGDSTAYSLWAGLGPWLRENGDLRPAGGLMELGCGLFAYGEMEKRGRWSPERDRCRGMAERWKAAALNAGPEVAVVLVGPWEVRNRRLSADEPPRALGDPVLDAATREAIVAAVDALTSAGASVVWVTSPHIRVPPLNGELSDADVAASDPVRIDRLNELVRDVARSRPDRVRVVDLARYLRERAGGEFDPVLRHDDVHFSPEGARAVAREWLGPEILRAARELRGGAQG